MSVREVLMSPGSWSVTLAEGTPADKLKLLDPFGCIVITPGRERAAELSTASLVTRARYTGPMRKRGGEYGTILEGAGNAIWLGDEDGKAKTYTAPPFTATSTLAVHVAERVIGSGRGNGITTSSTVLTGASQDLDVEPGDTPRAVLDLLCDDYDVEWRISPDFRLSVHTQGTLYPTNSSPTLVVRKDAGGRDLNITGLAAKVAATIDAEDYTTKVAAKATTGALGSASVVSPYYAPDGTPVEWERYIDSQASNGAAATRLAARQLGRFNTILTQVTVDTEQYDVRGDLQVGDTIFVFDPALGLVDTANRVPYRGQEIHPKKIRVVELDWPVEEGMGVFFRRPDATGSMVDLTDWVVWESSGASLGLGQLRRKPTGLTKGFPQP